MNVDTGEFRALSERAAAAGKRVETTNSKPGAERAGGRRSPGSGSRARSRELGYADGMLEMSQVLDGGARAWLAAEFEELEAGNLGAAEAMGKVGAWLERYSRHAFRTWELHQDYLGRFARDVEHLAYLEREGYAPPAAREQPRREQSENN